MNLMCLEMHVRSLFEELDVGPMELMCSTFWMTKVLSIYISHNFDGYMAVLMALVSDSSMTRLATIEMMGDPMAAPCTCS